MCDCVRFGGRIAADGYGRNPDGTLAHRTAYCAAKGIPLPAIAGLHIRHRCDVTWCVNPLHLEPGTHADNMRDKAERGRAPSGVNAPSAKLTEAEVAAIRELFIARHPLYGARALGREYGITHPNVMRIVRGLSYK